VSPAKTAEVIELPFGLRTRVSQKNHELHGVQIPHGKGNFEGETGEPVCSIETVCGREKTAELIDLLFVSWTRVGRRMYKFMRIRQVAPMCNHGRTRCRHLTNTIEPSVYVGDAPYVKLL